MTPLSSIPTRRIARILLLAFAVAGACTFLSSCLARRHDARVDARVENRVDRRRGYY